MENLYNTIPELLERNAKKFPEHFMLNAEDNVKISFKEFDRITNKVANLLKANGIKRGDKFTIILPNSLEILYLFFGSAKIGAVACPVNPELMPNEISYCIEYSESKIMFVHSDYADKLRKIEHVKEMPIFIIGAKVDRYRNFEDGLKKYPDAFKSNALPDDLWLMIYTSGTTGKPKGVALTQKNSLVDAYYTAEFGKVESNYTAMCVMPLFHSGGINYIIMTALTTGANIVICRKFSKSQFWERIEKYRINYTMMVPTMLSILLNPPEDVSKRDISSYKFTYCNAAPLPLELAKRFEETFEIPICEGYGLSETTCTASLNPRDKRRKLGSIGIPLPCNEIKIFDENDNEVKVGEHGEIVIRDENVMPGYYKLPEANKTAFRNGRFHSGDIGYFGKDGYLYIVGRKKEIIIRGGEKIAPQEIDNLIYTHPAISDSATIGVPDKIYGEEIKSFVVLKPRKSVTEKELHEFCQKKIPHFKCPKSIEFLNEIPKGPSGKLLRRELLRNHSPR